MDLPKRSLTHRGMSALYLHGPPVWVLNGGFGPKMVNRAYTPTIFSAPGGSDLAARVKSALRAAGFPPETIGTPGADGLLVGAVLIVRDPESRLHPTDFENHCAQKLWRPTLIV